MVTVDLKGQKFREDKYGEIDRLRDQNWYAQVNGGYVFFNQDEAVWVLKCEDFCFNCLCLTAATAFAATCADPLPPVLNVCVPDAPPPVYRHRSSHSRNCSREYRSDLAPRPVL